MRAKYEFSLWGCQKISAPGLTGSSLLLLEDRPHLPAFCLSAPSSSLPRVCLRFSQASTCSQKARGIKSCDSPPTPQDQATLGFEPVTSMVGTVKDRLHRAR